MKDYKLFRNRVAHLLENGEWKKAIDTMAGSNMSVSGMYKLCDEINFYPSSDFNDYAQRAFKRRQAELSALRTLNNLF